MRLSGKPQMSGGKFWVAKNRLKKVAKTILGRDVNGRAITVFPDDVFITSFPRSGNTWLRFLVSNLVWREESTTFMNVDKRVPPIYRDCDRYFRQIPRPRYLKSHECFDPRYPKILYAVRDVRSVLVSYYYYLIRRGELDSELSFRSFAELLVSGEIWPCSWRDHVLSWIRLRGHASNHFLLIRYEDLLTDSLKVLRAISSFLELDSSDEELKHVLDLSSFDRMRNLEKETGDRWKEASLSGNKKIPFVRTGKAKEWEDVLDRETLKIIQESCGELLAELGYDA